MKYKKSTTMYPSMLYEIIHIKSRDWYLSGNFTSCSDVLRELTPNEVSGKGRLLLPFISWRLMSDFSLTKGDMCENKCSLQSVQKSSSLIKIHGNTKTVY